MLRIGSMDYEPSPVVKPHTLDQRLIETLNTAQLYDTKAKLQLAEEFLDHFKKPGVAPMVGTWEGSTE